MAEMEGFEPSIKISPDTRLAIELLRPLGHISYLIKQKLTNCEKNKKTEVTEGFEPSVGTTYDGFQNRYLQPLGHVTKGKHYYNSFLQTGKQKIMGLLGLF